MVRRVPVTTQRIEYEERVESTPVQVCRMTTEVRKVMVPKTVAQWVPSVTTQYVPRSVVLRVPLDVPAVTYEATTPSNVRSVPASPPAAGDGSVLVPPNGAHSDAPRDTDPTGTPALDKSDVNKPVSPEPTPAQPPAHPHDNAA